MKYAHLKGVRYANWARRSDIVQDTSIEDQLMVNNGFADQHAMVHVRDFVLEASGSLPGARDDIPSVIDTCVKNDISVILLHDVSRLTRSGIEHGMKVLYELKAEGIEPVFVRDDIPGGEWAPMFQTLLLFAANQFSKKLADTSTRSSQLALEDDRIPVAKLTPYGLDRLVCALDGTHLFRVRNADGNIQQRLHPIHEGIVFETFIPNSEGKRGFYSKQRTEKVYWIEGDKDRADRVRWMFTQYFLSGASFLSIAEALNAQMILSPNGRRWRARTVSQILRNPAYTGRGLANSYTQSVYAMRSKGGESKAASVDFKTLAKRRRPPRIRRPEREWFWRDEPYLQEFLPQPLKSVVEDYQSKHLSRIKDGHVPKPGGDPHTTSPYVLKNILVTKDGRQMIGQGGKDGSRYYAVRYQRGLKRRLVSAAALEMSVLSAVRDVLLEETDLRQRILTFVKREASAASSLQERVNDIRSQRDKLLSRIEFLMDRVSRETAELTERKIRESEAELSTVNQRLRAAEGEIPAALRDVEGTADAVVAAMARIGQDLHLQSAASLRRLLGHLVERLEIDLESLEVELSLRLPKSTILSAYDARVSGCVDASSDPTCCIYTTGDNTVELPELECQPVGEKHTDRCWKCLRKARYEQRLEQKAA